MARNVPGRLARSITTDDKHLHNRHPLATLAPVGLQQLAMAELFPVHQVVQLFKADAQVDLQGLRSRDDVAHAFRAAFLPLYNGGTSGGAALPLTLHGGVRRNVALLPPSSPARAQLAIRRNKLRTNQ